MYNRKKRCLLCGNQELKLFYSELNLKLYKCYNCNFVFVYPQPNEKEFTKNLEINYIDLANKYSKAKPKKRNTDIRERGIWEKKKAEVFRRDLEAIGKYIKKVGMSKKIRLLDVGCGEGHFILEAQKEGFNCEGIEPSKSHKPDNRFGLKVFKGFLDDFAPKNKYDIVTLLDVLEHTKDPLHELERVKEIMNDSGVLTIRVPNLRWLVIKERLFKLMGFLTQKDILQFNPQGVYSPHTHLYTFSEKSIKKLLNKAGFEILGFEIINASLGANLLKNIFYETYYFIVKFIYKITHINLAISLNVFAKSTLTEK